jgi:hypothetical protein
MINLVLNFWQLILVIFVIIVAYLLGQQIVKVLFKIIFTSKPMMTWNMKRQIEQQKLVLKNRRLVSRENLLMLGQLLEEINKSLQNNRNRKRFYIDFALNKETREGWIKIFLQGTEEPRKSEPKKEEQKDETV